eukprot:COSAG05_NODE_5596_length_1133_cov_25.148539_2_plen_141_part_00
MRCWCPAAKEAQLHAAAEEEDRLVKLALKESMGAPGGAAGMAGVGGSPHGEPQCMDAASPPVEGAGLSADAAGGGNAAAGPGAYAYGGAEMDSAEQDISALVSMVRLVISLPFFFRFHSNNQSTHVRVRVHGSGPPYGPS